MYAVTTAFPWGTVVGDLLVAAVLGTLAYGRKQIKRELIEPMKNLHKVFRRHVKDDKKFQRSVNDQLFELSGRLRQYEASVQRERKLRSDEGTS